MQDYSSFTERPRPSKGAFGNWVWVIVFAVGFAWVESAVVVYLRQLFYEGMEFTFPLILEIDSPALSLKRFIRIEFFRETATLIMLVAVGCIAGRNGIQRFSFFIIAFGVWDIFYYVWLKVIVDWPESLLTWDLLFLIPVPWVSPVIAPVLIAVTMMLAGSLLIYYDEKQIPMNIRWFDWFIELFLAMLMIVAFCWDWKNIMQQGEASGIPQPFFWKLFLAAYVLSVVYFFTRLKQFGETGYTSAARGKSIKKNIRKNRFR